MPRELSEARDRPLGAPHRLPKDVPTLQAPSGPRTHGSRSLLHTESPSSQRPLALETQTLEGPRQRRTVRGAGERPTHTWAGDGGESPRVSPAVLVNAPPTPGLEMVENPQGSPPAYQAEDTNPYPDLLASAWMAPAAEVSSLWLHPMQWPVQLPAGLRPAFLVSGPARSRPG